jgi:hypothetical protein
VEPPLQLRTAAVRDREGTAVGPLRPLDRLESYLTALLHASQSRIHLRVRQRTIRREIRIEEPLQVVTVVRLLLEKPEQGVRNAHGRNYACSL